MNKKILTGLVAIILGAIGSALWEVILRPGFSFLGSAVLTAITFGSQVLTDDIYSRVGRIDLAASYSATTAQLIALLLTCFFIVACLSSSSQTPFLPKLRFERYALLLLLFMTTAGMFVTTRNVYVLQTRSHFQNLYRASSPYLTQEQRLSIDSRLVLVAKKSDYDKLVEELQMTLRSHNINFK